MTRLLVTGAAGGVGRSLVPGLADYGLRLTDLGPAGPGEWMPGNLAEPGLAERLCDGVDAVLHLAGNPRPGDPWDRLRGPNIDALTRLLEAAAGAGVRRVVLASSVHALGGYHPGPIRDEWPARPCCRYGATKVFAEVAGRVYADAGAFSVVCLRLGGCRPAPPNRAWFDAWLGTADLTQAVRCALRAEVRFGAYTITSLNSSGVFDLGAARRDLGYTPTETTASFPDTPAGAAATTLCR